MSVTCIDFMFPVSQFCAMHCVFLFSHPVVSVLFVCPYTEFCHSELRDCDVLTFSPFSASLVSVLCVCMCVCHVKTFPILTSPDLYTVCLCHAHIFPVLSSHCLNICFCSIHQVTPFSVPWSPCCASVSCAAFPILSCPAFSSRHVCYALNFPILSSLGLNVTDMFRVTQFPADLI